MLTVVEIFELAESHLNLELPFVIYCKPEENVISILLQKDNSTNIVNDFSESGFAFAPFLKSDILFIPESYSERLSAEFKTLNATLTNSISYKTSFTDQKNYLEMVEKAISAIHNGLFDKVVLSRKEIIALENFSIRQVFSKMLNKYPSTFRYCFFHPKIGMWIGASPEQLAKVEGNKFKTVALAGTRSAENAGPEWGSKELHEQKFVTDFIRDNLSQVCSNISVGEPFTQHAGSLAHIKTEIIGTLNENIGVQDLLLKLHPTPAVCGTPKESARNFIVENEGYDREYYTGFYGELNRNGSNADIFVNLRCMKISDNNAHLYIGCGITADSIPESEFQETVYKSETMKQII